MSAPDQRHTESIIIGCDERGLGPGWYDVEFPDFIRWTRRRFSFTIKNSGSGKLMMLACSPFRDGARKMRIEINGGPRADQWILSGWNIYRIDTPADAGVLDVHIRISRPAFTRWREKETGDQGIMIKAVCVGDEKDIYAAADAQRNFLNGLPGTEAMPVRLTVNNTDRCNLNCPMCPKQRDDEDNLKKAEMPEELFEKIFSEAAPYLYRLHLSTNGEPLLTRGLKRLLDRARKLSLGIDITTNGLLLRDPELIEKILRSVSLLVVSIDAATGKTYAKIRDGADFNQLMRNLYALKEMRKKIKTRQDFKLEFHYVLMRKNIEEFPDFVALAKEMGADCVTTRHVNIFKPEFTHESLIYHKRLANDCIREAGKIAEELGIPLSVPALYAAGDHRSPQGAKKMHDSTATVAGPPKAAYRKFHAPLKILKAAHSRLIRRMSSATPVAWGAISPYDRRPRLVGNCDFLWKQAIIEINGDFILCCNVHPRMPSPGNVTHLTVREIWNGETYRGLRKSFLSGKPPLFCRHCSFIIGEPSPDDEETYFKFSLPPAD